MGRNKAPETLGQAHTRTKLSKTKANEVEGEEGGRQGGYFLRTFDELVLIPDIVGVTPSPHPSPVPTLMLMFSLAGILFIIQDNMKLRSVSA